MNVVASALIVIILVAVVGAVGAASFLVLRRIVIQTRGGLFDCAIASSSSARPRWRLALGLYRGDELQIHLLWSLRLTPHFRIKRAGARIVDQHAQSELEHPAIYWASDIVRLRYTAPGGASDEPVIALGPGSLVAMLIWLESAPPGQGRSF